MGGATGQFCFLYN